MNRVMIVRRRKLGMSSVKGIVEASQEPIRWCRNDRGIPVADTYIRWGCTADLPINRPAKIINFASAIHEVNDKAGFRMKMSEAGVAPESWSDVDEVPDDKWTNGVVIRPSIHSRGRHIWLVHSYSAAVDVIEDNNLSGYYLSRYINKVSEFRVAVVSGRAVWVAKKTPSNPDDLAWNVARGGRFDNVNWDAWPLKVVRIAIEAFNLSSLDFGGVDVMVDADGNAYVIEINSAPSLTSPYRQQCMAKAFDWMVSLGDKERIPLIEERGGYRKFIHPAVSRRAILIGDIS